eukprot:UN17837
MYKKFLDPFEVKTSSKTRQEPYKIVTKTRHILTSKFSKVFLSNRLNPGRRSSSLHARKVSWMYQS